jgi:hypothetical protein
MAGRIARMPRSVFAAFSLLAAIWAFLGSPAYAEKRVALVIGNSAYQHAVQLANPDNDARLMADTLLKLGFFVVGGGAKLDLDKAGFDAALTDFGKELNGADVALFYYAGHGIETHGLNYLVPIDTNPVDEGDVLAQGVGLAGILDQIEKGSAKINILLLDACRDNPFRDSGVRTAKGGLAQMEAPPGTLISFATQPRSVALDGANGDSPYTRALAETIQHPGYGLFKTFNEVGLKVEKATHGSQLPWVSLSPISGNFYFAGKVEPATTAAPAAGASAPTEVARLTPPEADQRRDLVTDCDRLAGMPSDTGIPTSLHGVELDKIDIPSAMLACNDAMEKYPDVPRFAFEAGRIAQDRKDFAQARSLYEKAFTGGYAIAGNALGNLYSDGEGVRKDQVQAAQWYKKSADAGEPAAMDALAWLYQTALASRRTAPRRSGSTTPQASWDYRRRPTIWVCSITTAPACSATMPWRGAGSSRRSRSATATP